ncbi:MAG: BatA domain-containing protein [Candidatus Binatus sp.]|uniref:BatA domain-containing protein n=1 Tax=Candidatus Binatus sp. TaxID=2811406 RepID=UPI00271A6433|nr:BatA domain-containing protein [Candidatus Binatus sp.]MDO8431376.1 BatA domain-containing protein [Candidatus Binatus sp.]
MGFLNPQNLIYALSIALLLAIYLRSRSRPTIEVSSLMLFDEAPAPVANVRHVRLDPLFWLEAAVLAALTLAIAGLYIRTAPSPGHGRSHALIFDLGAGMSAREGSSTRLGEARRVALEIINQAPVDDEFSVSGYALEAQVIHPQSSNLGELRNAIAGLEPMAVPARTAALRAALMRARGASVIDLFADRTPPAGILADVSSVAKVNFHLIGSSAANLAIVSLDSGIPGATKGRATIRNFSAQPHPCDLAIELNNTGIFRQTLMLAPREQMVVPFGPLLAGGTLRARILSDDAIEADNSRYAHAASGRPARMLVLSPDASVRDDVARVLLAVDSNFQVETADPASFHPAPAPGGETPKPYELVVMHDAFAPAVASVSTLLIYPPAARAGQQPPFGILVEGTVSGAQISDALTGVASGAKAMALESTRIIALPDWIEAIAIAATGGRPPFPAAALGRSAAGSVGLIAFDVRDHLLLAPDHLDALVVTVDLVKRLTATQEVQIAPTGSYLTVPAVKVARVTNPDGSVREVAADKWGRARIRPMQSGRYQVESGSFKTAVLANYYDATESDLAPRRGAQDASSEVSSTAASANPAREVRPLLIVLAALALLALLLESALLIRHARWWGMRHV